MNNAVAWNQEVFSRHLHTDIFDIKVFDKIESTNNTLLSLIKNHSTSKLCCILGLNQTKGKGRQGKTWLSDQQHSLTFSIDWICPKPIQTTSAIALVVAVVIAETLKELSVPNITIKWPNDILKNHQKLAGILIETASYTSSQCHLVIGVGINISASPNVKERIDQPFSDCTNEFGETPSREKLLALLLNKLSFHLAIFNQKGFQPFINTWMNWCDHAQQNVLLTRPDNSILSGQHIGILEDGSIQIKDQYTVHSIHTGEISLRRLNS